MRWSTCPECGAVIADQTTHEAWHQTITPAATGAVGTETTEDTTHGD